MKLKEKINDKPRSSCNCSAFADDPFDLTGDQAYDRIGSGDRIAKIGSDSRKGARTKKKKRSVTITKACAKIFITH